MAENSNAYEDELRTVQVFAALHPHISKYAPHGWPPRNLNKRIQREYNIADTCGGPEFWIRETLAAMGRDTQSGDGTLYNAVMHWMYPQLPMASR